MADVTVGDKYRNTEANEIWKLVEKDGDSLSFESSGGMIHKGYKVEDIESGSFEKV